MNAVRIYAPAKVNLGLAVLGKRPDGFHDIDTIMAMIDLADVLTIRRTDGAGVAITGMEDVPVETNLVTRAIHGFCDQAGITPGFHVDIEKHIPAPAGLGGGSSDAAAALRALDGLFPGALTAGDIHDVAASIGSDCPFFLGAPAARATGTGTKLRPLSPPSGWVVVIVPRSGIEAKTATLYSALQHSDYVPSSAIDRVEHDLSNCNPPLLVNSFTRAARALLPGVNLACEAMLEVAGTFALTGAGPAVYALAADRAQSRAWRADLVHRVPGDYTVVTSQFLTATPAPEPLP